MENYIAKPIKIIWCDNHNSDKNKKVAVMWVEGKNLCQSCLNKLKEKSHVYVEEQLSFEKITTSWMVTVGRNSSVDDRIEYNPFYDEYELEFAPAEELFEEEKGKKKNKIGLVKTAFGDKFFTLEFKSIMGDKTFIGYFSEKGYCTQLQLENGKIIKRSE